MDEREIHKQMNGSERERQRERTVNMNKQMTIKPTQNPVLPDPTNTKNIEKD